jgi:hypothetical protein
VDGIALKTMVDVSKWLGPFAIVGGVPTTIAGIVTAYTGFSRFAMA